MRRREDMNFALITNDFTGQRMERHDLLDLIAKHLDPDRELLIHRNNLDCVSADTESTSLKGDVISFVLNVDKLAKQGITFDLIPHLDMNHSVDIFLRCSKTVNTGHCRNDDYITPSQQGIGCRMSESFDLVIDAGILLDEGIGLRYISLWLVIVVIRDEVLDCIVRK